MVCLLLIGMIYQHSVINYIKSDVVVAHFEVIGYCTFDHIRRYLIPECRKDNSGGGRCSGTSCCGSVSW